MSEYVYLNGAIIPGSEAKISVFDAGLTHAAGLFETFRAYNGKVMRLEDHLQRLTASSASLELELAVDQAAIKRGIAELLAANNLSNARLRLTLTPGSVARPRETPAERPEPTVLIVASEVEGYPDALYT
ncbi:MAG: aminotransferase class IV, partial [Phycisphaerae bacterium]